MKRMGAYDLLEQEAIPELSATGYIFRHRKTKADMIIGLITGIVGLMICVLNYPIYSYIKGNK